MPITMMLAPLLAMQTTAATLPEVGLEELARGDNEGAIAAIETSDDLDVGDPARLINLGVAHAREGDEERARRLFEAAESSDERYEMQTAAGEWVDSRHLARRALRMLDRGDFVTETRVSLR